MQTEKKAKVAIIGLGNLGKILAANLVTGKREVIVADAIFGRAAELSDQLGILAVPMEVTEAIRQADILILALHFASIQEFLLIHATELNGKTIIDPSNPIAPYGNGSFTKIVGENESAGQIISSSLPLGAKIAKAFGTLGVASLSTAAHQQPAFVQFYAIDDPLLKEDIESLIRDNGFEPVHVGGLHHSIRIEVFGDLNEFGAVGRPIDLEEAVARL